MGDEPEVVNRVPDEAPKPEVKKPSKDVFQLLKFLCIRELIGKWEVLKDKTANFGKLQFKIEQSLRPSEIEIYFMDATGKLSRAFRARELFMEWEEKHLFEFGKFAAELLKKEKVMVAPLKYEKGDYKKSSRVMQSMGEPEKNWLTTRLTPSEQLHFLQQHELWDVEKGDER